MSHPEQIQHTEKMCAQLTEADLSGNQACTAADKARHEVSMLIAKLLSNPQAFGGEILTLQTHTIEMQAQLDRLKKDKKAHVSDDNIQALEKQVNQQIQDLKYHLAIVRLMESVQ